MNAIATLLIMANTNAPLPEISKDNLKATIDHLAAYGTRNTNTEQCEQAAQWLAEQFRKIPGLKVEIMKYPVQKGRRIVADKVVSQVIATLPGTESGSAKGDQKILVGGHFDTINLTGDPLTVKAPGANDDASGVALTLELARVLSTQKHKHTLVFIAFSGEEQGLFGSTALAKRAVAEKWNITAFLNNDTVGASVGANRKADKKRVRLYSEETDTHHSRELARFIEWLARTEKTEVRPWLIYRRDRFQRGGDHTPFNREGFNAVRFIESLEALAKQHTDKDTPDLIDYRYLSAVVKVNLLAMSRLANAGPAPTEVKYDPKQGYDTTLSWKGDPTTTYRVYWRETSTATWQGSATVTGATTFTVKGFNKDDHTFAVGAEGGIPVSAEPKS